MIGFDLLGDPIPEGHGERGRPEHVPTAQNVNKVRLLLTAGLTKARIAQQLGITSKTLSKHYFHSGKVNLRHAREMALAETKARTLLQLAQAADGGNVSAMKEIRKIVEGEFLRDLPTMPSAKVSAAPLGKKEARRESARQTPSALDDLIGENDRPN